jgi:peptidoglycan hydrolase CwlO-like protein
MSIELSTLISIISVSIALITIFYNIARNGRKDVKEDVKEDATQMATVLTELKNIMDGISDIKKEITDVKNDVKADRDRITRLEESAKQAHKRIDEIISRIERKEGK